MTISTVTRVGAGLLFWAMFVGVSSFGLAAQSKAPEPGMGASPYAERELKVDQDYLNLPIKNGAAKRKTVIIVDGKVAREFELELAETAPDWWAFMDLAPFKGKTATIRVENASTRSSALNLIEQGNTLKGAENVYREPLRPQFHFSSRRGWNNDPNGLVFYKGEYHLFYQHNPYGWDWGNMHWGHAISTDLVHWKELPIALYPDEHGAIWSGSAVVDRNNTAGFGKGKEKPLVCIFTAAGKPFSQGLAYSNDRGRTWEKYADNPVLQHVAGENRDPKVLWYAPDKKWVMALYLEKDKYGLFSSPDLKSWSRLSELSIPGTSECPELFEIAVDGNRQNPRWVMYGGNGRYLIGQFDGRTFTAESGPHSLNFGNCFYASQTYNDIPPSDGRRILIPWGQMATPGMPFNQMMGLPVELTLRRIGTQLCLRANPVRELASLRAARKVWKAFPLAPGANPLSEVRAELLELTVELEPGGATELGLVLRGVPVRYDVQKQELTCHDKQAPLHSPDGRIRLRFFVDRTSIDIFGNDGALYMPMGVILPQDNHSFELYAKGGEVKVNSLEIHHLTSAWDR